MKFGGQTHTTTVFKQLNAESKKLQSEVRMQMSTHVLRSERPTKVSEYIYVPPSSGRRDQRTEIVLSDMVDQASSGAHQHAKQMKTLPI